MGFGLLVFGKLLIYYLRPTTKNPQPFFIYFYLLIFENPARKSKGKIGQKADYKAIILQYLRYYIAKAKLLQGKS